MANAGGEAMQVWGAGRMVGEWQAGGERKGSHGGLWVGCTQQLSVMRGRM